VLEIRSVEARNDRDLPALRGISLSARAGEIVGIAGVAGNGQSELAEVITGLREATAGRVLVHDEEITNRPATAAIDHGVAHIPADRTGVGTAPNLSVADNLIMKSYRHPPVGHGWAISSTETRKQAETLVSEYDVKTPDIDTPARLLSGGNLQKLILAREISMQPQAIVAVYPTRGLDVGAIESVHRLLIEGRERGAAILLISEELDELLSLADRIAVIYEGQIMGEVPPDDSRIADIGLMMAGTRAEAKSELAPG
jgi:simple sugar transport system ATP-binding protein